MEGKDLKANSADVFYEVVTWIKTQHLLPARDLKKKIA